MKMRKSVFLCCIIAVLAMVACGTSGGGGAAGQPIGNATGTATGTAQGYSSVVSVTVTLADGMITDVVIDGSGETQAIAGPAIMRAPGMIMRGNSADFDAIAGATITCMAIAEATQKAIDEVVAAGN